jgi:hypothetical protein
VNRTEIRRLEALIKESEQREVAWLRATVAELTAENHRLRALQIPRTEDCRHHPTPPRV